MRIRTVKPEFWSHPILSGEPDEVRLAALGLLNIADDEGYFLAKSALIRSALWPLDEDSTKARRTIARLIEIGYIQVREHETHGSIGFVENFTKHQRVDRPNASKIRVYFDSSNDRRMIVEHSCPEQGTGNREQGSGEALRAPPAPRLKDEWRYVKNEPWARALQEAGCLGFPKDWLAWQGVVERCGGFEYVATAAKTLPASKRYHDQVEAASTKPAPKAFSPELAALCDELSRKESDAG